MDAYSHSQLSVNEQGVNIYQTQHSQLCISVHACSHSKSIASIALLNLYCLQEKGGAWGRLKSIRLEKIAFTKGVWLKCGERNY